MQLIKDSLISSMTYLKTTAEGILHTLLPSQHTTALNSVIVHQRQNDRSLPFIDVKVSVNHLFHQDIILIKYRVETCKSPPFDHSQDEVEAVVSAHIRTSLKSSIKVLFVFSHSHGHFQFFVQWWLSVGIKVVYACWSEKVCNPMSSSFSIWICVCYDGRR